MRFMKHGETRHQFVGALRTPVEQPRRLQERREVDEPAHRGDAGSGSPVDLETPAERREAPRFLLDRDFASPRG